MRRIIRVIIQNSKKIIYNRAKAKCLWLCNEARKQSWIQFITTINQYTTMLKIWEKVNKISGKYKTSPTPMLEVNNIIYQDHTDPTVKPSCPGQRPQSV